MQRKLLPQRPEEALAFRLVISGRSKLAWGEHQTFADLVWAPETAMPDIKHSIQIAAKPEAIYTLVATANGFSQWWAADIRESESAVELGFFSRATVYRLELKLSQPPEQAEWICLTGDEWNGTHITFRLEASPSGTLVRFSHSGWRAETDYFVSCNTTWGELMFRLKAAGEGKSPRPLFLASTMAY